MMLVTLNFVNKFDFINNIVTINASTVYLYMESTKMYMPIKCNILTSVLHVNHVHSITCNNTA